MSEAFVQLLTEHLSVESMLCHFSTGFPIDVDYLVALFPFSFDHVGCVDVVFSAPLSFVANLSPDGIVRLMGLKNLADAERARAAVVEFLASEDIPAEAGQLQEDQVICTTSFHNDLGILAMAEQGSGHIHPRGLVYHNALVSAIFMEDGDLEIRARTTQHALDALERLLALALPNVPQ